VRAREFLQGQTASAAEVLNYVKSIHQQDDDMRRLQQMIGRYPQWELRTMPLSQLHIPDAYYPDDPEPDLDPYGRVMAVDYDYAGEVSAHNVDRLPIVIDPQDWIIDGNHRAWAAAELLGRDSIRAWVAVKGKPVIDMLEEGCLELSRMLEERPQLIENYEGWREIQSLLSRIVGEEPVIGRHYSVLNLIITPPGRFLMQQGIKTPVKLIGIRDRGSYVQYEFDAGDKIFRFPEDHRAGDRLSKTFLFSGPRELEKTQTFVSMSLQDWEIRDRITENFADGRKPGRKGLSKRVGIPQKATLGQLEKIAKSSTGERRRMAQWQLNMRRGRKKN
jgi:hypothetical protein